MDFVLLLMLLHGLLLPYGLLLDNGMSAAAVIDLVEGHYLVMLMLQVFLLDCILHRMDICYTPTGCPNGSGGCLGFRSTL